MSRIAKSLRECFEPWWKKPSDALTELEAKLGLELNEDGFPTGSKWSTDPLTGTWTPPEEKICEASEYFYDGLDKLINFGKPGPKVEPNPSGYFYCSDLDLEPEPTTDGRTADWTCQYCKGLQPADIYTCPRCGGAREER